MDSELRFDGVIDGTSPEGTLHSKMQSVFAYDRLGGGRTVTRSEYDLKLTRSAER